MTGVLRTYDPARYSHVQAAANAGCAMLAIDRPGAEPETGLPACRGADRPG